MVNQAHAFNTKASYERGGVCSATKDQELQNVNIQVTTGTASFGTAFPDILSAERYKLPRVKSDDVVDMCRCVALKPDEILAKQGQLCSVVCHHRVRCLCRGPS